MLSHYYCLLKLSQHIHNHKIKQFLQEPNLEQAVILSEASLQSVADQPDETRFDCGFPASFHVFLSYIKEERLDLFECPQLNCLHVTLRKPLGVCWNGQRDVVKETDVSETNWFSVWGDENPWGRGWMGHRASFVRMCVCVCLVLLSVDDRNKLWHFNVSLHASLSVLSSVTPFKFLTHLSPPNLPYFHLAWWKDDICLPF